jgi:hypothetical protein
MQRIDLAQSALANFADAIAANFSILVAAQPEDQLKAPVQTLLTRIGDALGIPVASRTESPLSGTAGRPDIAVVVHGLLAGYVELKAPGRGARPETLRGGDRLQWNRFSDVPNLLYTDGSEWSLYRSGELAERVRIASDVRRGRASLSDSAAGDLTRVLNNFLLWAPLAPTSPSALARLLAPLCRLVRQDVLVALADPLSNLSQLAVEWRKYLFPDADDAQFADAYAQTLTYALLLARLSGAKDLSTASAAASLDAGHGLLAQALRVLGDPQAKAEITTGVDLLERSLRAVDIDQIGGATSLPWLYFYEDFLAAYDPQLRKDRGVYYTPAEVVRAQVQLSAVLLQQRFGRSLAFADSDVVVLDPAAGTGTYPVAIAQHALAQVEDRFGPGAVPQAAESVAANVHAFELLVGPYAVAHLRLTQLFLSAGARLEGSGVHVYLTDTLESPHATPPGQQTLFHKRLAEEHRRAQVVKANTRVLVCIGNPPYDRQSIAREDSTTERKGGWVRFGDDGRGGILSDFTEPAVAAGKGIHLKNLFNDYVYFWRWALWKVFDATGGPGIVTYITASSYLRGPAFAGMREYLRRTVDELWIVDLEGDNRGPRKTENVFAIQTPVAIAVGVRYGPPSPDEPAQIHYTRLTGTREEKLARLGDVTSFEDLEWADGQLEWQAPFLPARAGNYWSWPALADLMPWQHSGVQAKRTWPIGESEELLRARWRALLAAPPSERGALLREADRTASRPYLALDGALLPPLAALATSEPPPDIVRYAYRAFDRQWLIRDPRLVDRIRPPLWAALSDRQVYISSFLSGIVGAGPTAIATAHVPDLHHFRGSFGAKDVIPLYRDAAATRPNVTAGVMGRLGGVFGFEITHEDLVAYVYALLSSSSYASQFSEELLDPGPRIPVTRDGELFKQVSAHGRRLIWLHTFGARFGPASTGGREVPQGRARAVTPIATGSRNHPDSFAYLPESRVLEIGEGTFYPVVPEVMAYEVSGLRVVGSWVAHRLRGGAGRRSSPLDDLRPDGWQPEFTQELLELLWVIEETIDSEPRGADLLEAVVRGPVFAADELPQPSPSERQPPLPDVVAAPGLFDDVDLE